MKIDYTTIIRDFGGVPIKEEKSEKPVTVKDVILMACRSAIRTDQDLSPMDKFSIGEIGHLAHKGLDLTTEQVSQIKNRVGSMFDPLTVWAFFKAIEDQPSTPEAQVPPAASGKARRS